MGNCAVFHQKNKSNPDQLLDIKARNQCIVYTNGLKIIKNKETGKLEGVPEEWDKNYAFTFGIDENKTVKSGDVPVDMRLNEKKESNLPEEIEKMTEV